MISEKHVSYQDAIRELWKDNDEINAFEIVDADGSNEFYQCCENAESF